MLLLLVLTHSCTWTPLSAAGLVDISCVLPGRYLPVLQLVTLVMTPATALYAIGCLLASPVVIPALIIKNLVVLVCLAQQHELRCPCMRNVHLADAQFVQCSTKLHELLINGIHTYRCRAKILAVE